MISDILSVFPKDQVLTPGDGAPYEEALHRWAENAERRAKFVLLPKSATDVSNALKFVVANGLEVAVKGGGHSASGASSSEDLVVDMRHLAGVSVDVEKSLITVGGGAVWAAVDAEAAKHGLATVGGTVNHTGVGGLTLGGGYGWLTPKYGLTIDNLVQAEVVTANGDILTCSETENPDLFWAIRGAGSNFGVVTYFTLKAYPQPNGVYSGMMAFTPAQLPAVIAAAQTWAAGASVDESCMVFFACPPPARAPAVVVAPFFNGSEEEGRARFKAFFDVGPVADMTRALPYEEQNAIQNPMATHGGRKALKSAPLGSVDGEVMTRLFGEYVELVEAYPDAKESALIVELHEWKKFMEVPFDATSFANRGPYYNVTFVMRWTDPALDATMRQWTATHAKPLVDAAGARPGAGAQVARGYANFGLGDERVRDVFGAHYDRLSELKARYDPDMVFRKWFPITPKGYMGA
ncbi:FAD-dependent oxidoreductase [Phanerochaete sordida]|uniref:FAD-dependent oxidoreductase n=1 Tax=Phanerochaete sordida TaxID=48140 RepID=A0A9P3G7E5_9APHY|nr:FAD-dependent oxidoreductase [Phanerochaete sordida]